MKKILVIGNRHHAFNAAWNIKDKENQKLEAEMNLLEGYRIKTETERDNLEQDMIKLSAAYNNLFAKFDKLKKLLLLVDPAVSNEEMNNLSIKQWNAFIEEFPDEA